MAKNRVLSLILAALTIVLLFGSCNQVAKNRDRLIGTWEGDGTLELMTMEMELGEELPFDVVEILHFAADGSGYLSDGTNKMEFSYKLTDDTLTFQFPEISMGRPYQFTGDTLVVSHSEFRRIA